MGIDVRCGPPRGRLVSWVLVSWILVHGFRFLVYWVSTDGFWFLVYWLLVPGFWFLVSCFRFLVSGSWVFLIIFGCFA